MLVASIQYHHVPSRLVVVSKAQRRMNGTSYSLPRKISYLKWSSERRWNLHVLFNFPKERFCRVFHQKLSFSWVAESNTLSTYRSPNLTLAQICHRSFLAFVRVVTMGPNCTWKGTCSNCWERHGFLSTREMKAGTKSRSNDWKS